MQKKKRIAKKRGIIMTTKPAWKNKSRKSTPKKSANGTWTTTTTDATMPRKGMVMQRSCIWKERAPAQGCAVRGCGITRVVAPLTAPRSPCSVASPPPRVCPFTDVNEETERRDQRSCRASDPRAAEDGTSDEEEERTRAAEGRAQTEGGEMANRVHGMETSESVVVAAGGPPVKVSPARIPTTGGSCPGGQPVKVEVSVSAA